MPDDATLASYYRMTAIVFWESAKRLCGSFDQSGDPIVGNRLAVPFYYLVSHAAELLLKCALLKRGTAQEDLLKHQRRHNMSHLLGEVKSKNIPVSERTTQIIDALGEQHQRHALRYSFLIDDEEVTFTPKPDDCFYALDELLMLGRISTHGV